MYVQGVFLGNVCIVSSLYNISRQEFNNKFRVVVGPQELHVYASTFEFVSREPPGDLIWY